MTEGFTCVPNNILKMLAPHPHLLATYMVIKSRCISSTGMWVSQETLAKELEVDVRTVKRRMKVLQEWGLISRKSRGKYKTKMTLLEHVGSDTDVPSRRDIDVPCRGDTDVPPLRRLSEEDKINNDEGGNMGWREDADKLEVKSKERTREARTGREEKKRKRLARGVVEVKGGPEELTHKDVIREFQVMFKGIMGRTPNVTPKDRKQAKMWVHERDALVCINMIKYVGDHHDALRDKFKWNGLSFGMLYGFRDGIFLAMRDVEKKKRAFKKIKTGGTW